MTFECKRNAKVMYRTQHFSTLLSVNLLLLILSSLLCMVFTIIYRKETMFFGYTVLQLFCVTCNVIWPVKYISFFIIIVVIDTYITAFGTHIARIEL